MSNRRTDQPENSEKWSLKGLIFLIVCPKPGRSSVHLKTKTLKCWELKPVYFTLVSVNNELSVDKNHLLLSALLETDGQTTNEHFLLKHS